MSYTQRFEDPRSFVVWKRSKKHQEASKLEANVAKTGLSSFG
jgi:hypothetical protein